MTQHVRILEHRYVDSVVLMRLAERLVKADGVDEAAALMATPANLALLREGGFLDGRVEAGPDDLLVAVKAHPPAAATAALAGVDALLDEGAAPPAGRRSARALDEALRLDPELDLAVVSVPGEYAAAEARRALERGLHVFLFSSGVSLEDEVELKRLAAERGLLCMGPDCGTAVVGGVGLGFANALRRGPIGVVGASGTGIQAVTSYLDGLGVGISHALGCGGRDLSDAVGAATMHRGLDALLADPATGAILLLSKPANPAVADRLRQRAARSPKPVVCCFLGDGGPPTLDAAARAVAQAAGIAVAPAPAGLSGVTVAELAARLAPTQHRLSGLYAGGTLAYEAQLVLRRHGSSVASNAPLAGAPPLAEGGDVVLDLGAEEFTRGRPHPMIDSRERRARLLGAAADPSVAVVLLDFVLGYGAAADPAGDLAETIEAARAGAEDEGRELTVLAFVCGTSADPQDRDRQEQRLRDAGALVLPTNARMAEAAAAIVRATRAAAPVPVAGVAR